MSVRVMAQVWDHHDWPAHLGPNVPALKLVALAIADHADHDGGNAWPTIARLASMTGLSRRTVQRSIAALTLAGLLDVDPHDGGDRDCPADRRPNRYRLTIAGRHGDTPPPTADSVDNPDPGRHPVTPRGVTQSPRGASPSHPRGVTVSPTGRHRDAQTVHEPSGTILRAGSADAGEIQAALVDALGATPETDLEHARLRRAVRSLTAVGATPAEIEHRARRYRAIWPTIPFTALGLVANWTLLAIPAHAAPGDPTHRRPADHCTVCNGTGWTFAPDDAHVEPCPCTSIQEARP